MPVISVTPERVAAVEESVREILREVQVLRLQAGSPASKTAVVRSAIDVYDPAVLLGNEPDPTAMAEDNEKLDLLAAQEETAQRRIEFGTLKNTTLRREAKLAALEAEYQLWLKAARDTAQEKRQAAERVARHADTLARVAQMEELADEQVEYGLTLEMMTQRYKEAKAGCEDAKEELLKQAKEVEMRRKKQEVNNGPILHMAWNAQHTITTQMRVAEHQSKVRQMLESKRHQVAARIKKASKREGGAIEETLAERRREEVRAKAEETVKDNVQLLQSQQVDRQLQRLESQFERVQQLMGFEEVDALVQRIVMQQQAGKRMEQAKIDVIARHEALLDLRASISTRYEEGRGGVRARGDPACKRSPRRHHIPTGTRKEEVAWTQHSRSGGTSTITSWRRTTRCGLWSPSGRCAWTRCARS